MVGERWIAFPSWSRGAYIPRLFDLAIAGGRCNQQWGRKSFIDAGPSAIRSELLHESFLTAPKAALPQEVTSAQIGYLSSERYSIRTMLSARLRPGKNWAAMNWLSGKAHSPPLCARERIFADFADLLKRKRPQLWTGAVISRYNIRTCIKTCLAWSLVPLPDISFVVGVPQGAHLYVRSSGSDATFGMALINDIALPQTGHGGGGLPWSSMLTS